MTRESDKKRLLEKHKELKSVGDWSMVTSTLAVALDEAVKAISILHDRVSALEGKMMIDLSKGKAKGEQ